MNITNPKNLVKLQEDLKTTSEQMKSVNPTQEPISKNQLTKTRPLPFLGPNYEKEQLKSIENQTSVMKEQTKVIQEGHESIKHDVSSIHQEVINLQQEVSILHLQLKTQKEESTAALKKEHRFTIYCSLATGTTATILGTLIATIVINTFF